MSIRRVCTYLVVLLLPICSRCPAADVVPVGKSDVYRLLQQLDSDDWVLQSESLERLGRCKIQQAAPRIEKLLSADASPWIRGRALVALTQIRGEAMLPEAKRLLQEEEPSLRKAALQSLYIIGDRSAADSALGLLDDEDEETRAIAASLCARHYPGRAWPVVQAMADDPRAADSVYLFRAMAAIGSEDSLARLEKSFATGDERLRHQAFRGLRDADQRAVPLLVRMTSNYKPTDRTFQLGRDILAAHDAEHVAAALRDVFASRRVEHYQAAAVLAADITPSKELEDAIVDIWMKQDDLPPETVRAGLVALTKLDPARHMALFRRCLASRDAATREQAVRCRGLCDKRHLFDELREHVRDEDHRVAQAALESLLLVPEEFRPTTRMPRYLKTPLQSDDRKVVLAALELLSNRRSDSPISGSRFREVLDVLRPQLGGGNDQLRAASADALTKLGGPNRTTAIVDAQGFIYRWKVIGTFLNDQSNTGFATVHPPQMEIDFGKTYESQYRWDFGGGGNELRALRVKWLDSQPPQLDGAVMLSATMPVPTKFAVAYAAADVYSDKDQTVRIAIQQPGTVRMWLRGEQVFESPVAEPQTGKRPVPKAPPKTDICTLVLKQGHNRLLLKTACLDTKWWIRVRLLDETTGMRATGVKNTTITPKAVSGGTRPAGVRR